MVSHDLYCVHLAIFNANSLSFISHFSPISNFNSIFVVVLIIAINDCFVAETVFMLAPLADEYQIDSARRDCQIVLQEMMRITGCTLEKLIAIHSLAMKYKWLDTAMEESAILLAHHPLADLQQQQGFKDTANKELIFKNRVILLEKKK